MGKPPVQIGRWTFPTKAAAERRIRDILWRNNPTEYSKKIGAPRSYALTGDDREFALALLELHPNRDYVKQAGVIKVFVQELGDSYDSRRFIVLRREVTRDGSTIESHRDFTWRHALYPRNPRQDVMKVFRGLIAEQVSEYRRDFFRKTDGTAACPVCGETITPKCSHVDHIYPDTFDSLVDRWLTMHKMFPEDIEIVPSAAYEEPSRIAEADRWVEEDWREFHRLNAKLRIVHPSVNLAAGNGRKKKAAS